MDHFGTKSSALWTKAGVQRGGSNLEGKSLQTWAGTTLCRTSEVPRGRVACVLRADIEGQGCPGGYLGVSCTRVPAKRAPPLTKPWVPGQDLCQTEGGAFS